MIFPECRAYKFFTFYIFIFKQYTLEYLFLKKKVKYISFLFGSEKNFTYICKKKLNN